MASKPVILTPEQIEAGVTKNAGEYNARVAALRALREEHAYNPAVDPATLQKMAAEATRGSGAPGRALAVYGVGGVVEGDVRMKGRDAVAEAQAKAGGGRKGRDGKAQDEESEGREGQAGDGGVQTGHAAFGVQARPQGAFTPAGGSHSAQPVGAGPKVEVYPASSEEDAKAQLATFNGPDVISATIRVKYSVVVVRE